MLSLDMCATCDCSSCDSADCRADKCDECIVQNDNITIHGCARRRTTATRYENAKPAIVCISGAAQHGKDTLGRALAELAERRDGHRVLITHNGDLLKFIVKSFFDWDGIKDEAGRSLLQHVGTDIVRAKYPNFWVDFLKFCVDVICADRFDLVLVPDCRFPNEIECWVGHPVLWVHIDRPGYDNGLTDAQQAHSSETALAGYEPPDSVDRISVINDKPDLFIHDALTIMDWVNTKIAKEKSNA